jgi:hypothetical protein
MRHELELSYDFSQGVNCFAFGSATGKRDMSHEDEVRAAVKSIANDSKN